jgi:CRP/FNR family transcriptional regulator, cyclic AMP receptor protein
MSRVLSLCSDFPEMQVPPGGRIIDQGASKGRLYVLKQGAFNVVRNGVRVVRVSEPGAFFGEISSLLGTPPTADVVALEKSVVYVIDDPVAAMKINPELTRAIAQLLARRLQAVTTYLVDLKKLYAGPDAHLELMDQVLAELMNVQHPDGKR